MSAVQLELSISSLWCQRFTETGHQTWRHGHDHFHQDQYATARIGLSWATPWISARHYSHSSPTDRFWYELFDLAADHPILGCVVFRSVPTRTATLTRAFPSLEPSAEILELGRACMDDAVPRNSDSSFIAQMLRVVPFPKPVAGVPGAAT